MSMLKVLQLQDVSEGALRMFGPLVVQSGAPSRAPSNVLEMKMPVGKTPEAYRAIYVVSLVADGWWTLVGAAAVCQVRFLRSFKGLPPLLPCPSEA